MYWFGKNSILFAYLFKDQHANQNCTEQKVLLLVAHEYLDSRKRERREDK